MTPLTADQILDGWHQLRRDEPNLSSPEIAGRLGVNYNAMRSTVQRARLRDDSRAVPVPAESRDTRSGRFTARRGAVVDFDPCALDEGESPA